MRQLAIGLALLAAIVVVIVVVDQIDMANRRRAHAENMKNVERFNEGFQQRFAQGAPSAAVDNYLRSKPVSFFHQARGEKTEYWVTVVRERAIWRFCGMGSAGLVILFGADHRLESVRVSFWSMDCL
jgi:hypothetical protein